MMSQHDQLGRQLRKMIAALEQERQGLATLDLDVLTVAIRKKEALCVLLEPISATDLDAENRALAQSAHQLNDVNRRVRNLLAANVATRLESLGVPQSTYRGSRFAASN